MQDDSVPLQPSAGTVVEKDLKPLLFDAADKGNIEDAHLLNSKAWTLMESFSQQVKLLHLLAWNIYLHTNFP
jgi:hypothetical protein